MIDPPTTLHRLQMCPFCERVGRRLDELDRGIAGIAESRPAAFLIGGDGVIDDAWVAGAWPKFLDYKAIEAAIEEL